MKRIFLFIVRNLAVLALLSVVIFVIEQDFGVRLGHGGLGIGAWAIGAWARVCG